MKRKSAFDLDGSEELSRLITKERLQRAGVKLEVSAGTDPELNELFERLRSTVKKSSTRTIPVDLVRKLAGG